jgi:putative heme-binding domain-containing protein
MSRCESKWLPLFLILLLGAGPGESKDVVDAAKDAKGLDSALKNLHAPMRESNPMSAADSLKSLKPRDGLTVDLIASEPVVRQPLNITFDERGRMWVTQYAQYPFPKGLKVVEYDQYIRAKFDKVPLPPPRNDRGADLITIHEDVKGDGTFSKVKTFVSGLNIATAALPGRGGVWVMNPPYLLFYPDKDHNDVPDGNPVVHLSGFGLEDTHAVANSLMWGPDGWIYGGHGSTCTAKVRVEITGETKTTDFLGQAIWRYHPEKHKFEIFAEGGGNTFGVEFDDKGRVYSGTNWSNLRGLHFVQGGYYVKGWGKHGPLTNPYAFGYFDHMPHTGNGDRLTHTFVVYGGGLLGGNLGGKIIGPSALQSRIHVTRLEPTGSTYKTVEEPFLLSSSDGWFRPVDLKVGPDGAIYVADFYEKRISHVDPRDNWDRATGRIYRVRPTNWSPGLGSFDLGKLTSDDLLMLLENKNRWYRATALRLLGDRKDMSVAPKLRQMIAKSTGQLALESLWALHVIGGLDQATALASLGHADPYVRLWTVRLLADEKEALAIPLFEKLMDLAASEKHAQIRSQLASSAKRLPGEQAVPLIWRMLQRDEDQKDPHIPLLLWWALEDKAVTHQDQIMSLFASNGVWHGSMVRGTIMQRLARRYAADATLANQEALVKLLAAAPGEKERRVLVAGIAEAFAGRPIGDLIPALKQALGESGNLEIAIRSGDKKAHDELLRFIASEDEKIKAQRVAYIELLGQVGRPEAAAVLLEVALTSRSHSVRRAALGAMVRFDDPKLAQQIVAEYAKLPADQNVRPAAINALISRPTWTAILLQALDSGEIPKTDISPDQLTRIRLYDDPSVVAPAEKVFGKPQHATSQQKEQEIARVKDIVTRGVGDPARGKILFTSSCAACHTLFNEGGKLGPDLTAYERRNVDNMVLSIVDPNAYIREEFTSFRVKTKDNQTLVGLITERNADQITLVDSSQQKSVIAKTQIKDERAIPISIMPEALLDALSHQQLRDLFSYLAADKPPKPATSEK